MKITSLVLQYVSVHGRRYIYTTLLLNVAVLFGVWVCVCVRVFMCMRLWALLCLVFVRVYVTVCVCVCALVWLCMRVRVIGFVNTSVCECV